ncbi:MAG: hypothetical protein RR249_10270 [Tannerellaceae bacterium]
MADQFDILDIVTDAVISANTGVHVFKGNSMRGEKCEHIVVAYLPINELPVVNKTYVNVNVFTKRFTDEQEDVERQRAIVRPVTKALRHIHPPLGMYWKSRIIWSESLGEAKDGFDCTNIRLEVITEKDE